MISGHVCPNLGELLFAGDWSWFVWVRVLVELEVVDDIHGHAKILEGLSVLWPQVERVPVDWLEHDAGGEGRLSREEGYLLAHHAT